MAFKSSVIGLALLTGCGTSATITRANAPSVDAKIVGGDRYDVHVQTELEGRVSIPRSEITDVDHPGNVAATLGGIVSAYGVANLAVGLPECDRQGAAYCAGVVTPLAIGLPVMIWGIATYAGSVSALGQGKGKSPKIGRHGRLFVSPTHQFAGQPETPGVTLGSTF